MSEAPDFTQLYNTQLSPQDEAAYQAWANARGKGNDTYDYDLRWAYQELNAGTMAESDRGHLGDKYKKPNHPTFSDESQYHGTDGYTGGQWIETPKGMYFAPGQSQGQFWPGPALDQYFQKREPDITLLKPDLRDRIQSNIQQGTNDPLTDSIAKARNAQILKTNGM